MKKAYTLIELLSVIVILAIISAIAYPKIIDVIASSKISAYNSAKGNIIQSAKLKYLADVNSSKVQEYSVDELIEEGYLNEETKNPLTNQKYENTKILITNEDGSITYNYVEGNTLYDIISTQNDKTGVYKLNEDYIYKGIDAKNYISFNSQIYRILKLDEYRNMYLLKDEINEKISLNNINEYIISYYNDNYSKEEKDNIISFDILNYNDYINTFVNNDTYIANNYNIWVKYDNQYKVLSYLNNEFINEDNANVRLVLKLKNNVVITNGDGSQLNPYIINN